MSLNYPRSTSKRMFMDNENTNNRFYRESEAHAKVYIAGENLREDFGFEKRIYEHTHDPSDTFQEIQGKMYRSE